MRAEDPRTLEEWTSTSPACRLQPGLAGQAAAWMLGEQGGGSKGDLACAEPRPPITHQGFTRGLLALGPQSGLPRWHSGKEPACQCRRHKRLRFDPWDGKIPYSRKRQPTPVFLPGKFHGQRSLEGYSPWGCKESGTTEHTRIHTQSVFQALPDLLLGRKTHAKFSRSLSGAPAWKARNAVVDGLGWGSEAVNGHFRHLCQDSQLAGPPRTAPGPETLPGGVQTPPIPAAVSPAGPGALSLPLATPGKRERHRETEVQPISRGRDQGMMVRRERGGGPPSWWQNLYLSNSRVLICLYLYSQPIPRHCCQSLLILSIHQLPWLCILNLLESSTTAPSPFFPFKVRLMLI